MDSQQRWRIIFAKGTPIKYVSHLDLHQTWERALRRAGVPLAYSQGFNPQAKLQLAAALPVGHTGSAELMDIILDRPMDGQEILSRLRPVLPGGLTISALQEVDLKTASLQSSLRQAEYRVRLTASVTSDEITQRVNQFMGTEHFEQSRVRKQRTETIDLRLMVHDLHLETAEGGEVVLWMRVSAGASGHVRPETVLEALGLADAQPQIERTKLHFEFDTPRVSGYNNLL
jgi:radical SAM-linked protein